MTSLGINITDIVDTIKVIEKGLDDQTPEEVKRIVRDEIIRIDVRDLKDHRLLRVIAQFMDVIETEYQHQKDKGEVKLNILIEEVLKVYAGIEDEMSLIDKVKRLAGKLKEIYKDLKE